MDDRKAYRTKKHLQDAVLRLRAQHQNGIYFSTDSPQEAYSKKPHTYSRIMEIDILLQAVIKVNVHLPAQYRSSR